MTNDSKKFDLDQMSSDLDQMIDQVAKVIRTKVNGEDHVKETPWDSIDDYHKGVYRDQAMDMMINGAIKETRNIYDGLVVVVQYRGKDGNHPLSWKTMAAFDIYDTAEIYMKENYPPDNPYWEYQIVQTAFDGV